MNLKKENSWFTLKSCFYGQKACQEAFQAHYSFSKLGGYSLEEISTQNGPFNSNSNSMSSFVSQWNCFKFEIPYRY